MSVTYVAEGDVATPAYMNALLAETAGEVHNVKAFGALGDASTDDSTALQAAITAAGIGGTVYFPPGDYRFATPLTPLLHQKWIGAAHPLGSGGARGSLLTYTAASGNAIEFSGTVSWENLTYVNSASAYTDATQTFSGSTAIGVSLTGDIVCKDCHFKGWYRVFSFLSTVYTRFYGCDFSRNAAAFLASSQVFNFECHGTLFRYTNTITVGTGGFRFENLKFFGCSVELYTNAFEDFTDVSLYGTYFETTYAGAFGFGASGLPNDVSIHLFGCKIFLNYHNRFVNLSGLTEPTFVSIGNQLEIGVTKAASGQNHFYIIAGADDGGKYVMLGDTMNGRGAVDVDQMTYLANFTGRAYDLVIPPHNDPTAISASVRALLPLPKITNLTNDATPSVLNQTLVVSGGTTTITDFDDGVVGQTFTLRAAHALTITHNASIIVLNGGANFTMAAGDTLTLSMFTDQVWHEVGRSDNTP